MTTHLNPQSTDTFPVLNGYAPAQGPKCCVVKMDFSLDTEFDIDFTAALQANAISFIQSIFVDNSLNLQPLTLVFDQTNQKIVVPASAQGVWPVIAPQSTKLKATSTGGVVVNLQAMNVPMPLTQWGPISVTANLVPASGSYTKKSLTLNGADQVVMAANPARKSYAMMAPSTNVASLFINFGAASAQDGTNYEIMPGGNLPAFFAVSLDAIHVIGTNADLLVAYELN